MNITNGIKSAFKKISNRWTALVAVVVMGVGENSCSSGRTDKSEDKKIDKQEQVAGVKNPVKQIMYVTDTLPQTKGRALLYYNNGKIVRNYVDKNNFYKMELALFSHEDWHAHNDEINWRYRYKYTPFEYYKLCIHNEISANIAALLTTRYQYMAAKNKKKFAKQQMKGVFGFYFDAVLRGKINPESDNPKKLEQEYAFIINGMQKVWVEKHLKWYMPSFYAMLQQYVRRQGLVEDSRKNYNYVRSHMYNIGGVDFSKYLQQDVMPSDERVFLADGLRKVKSMNDGGLDMINNINNKYALLNNVALERKNEAFQHLLISAKLKQAMHNVTVEELQANPQIVDMYYRQVISKIQKDKAFEDFVCQFPAITEKSCAIRINKANEYREIISEMYTFKGIDLSKSIKDFKVGKVPVKITDFRDFDFTDNNYLWGNVSATYAEIRHNKYSGPIIINSAGSSPKAEGKKRMSGRQFITAPNYREPILISDNKKDKELILKVIKEFDEMPQVLKECDTEAQQKYYASLEKSAEKQNKLRQKNMPARKFKRQKIR